MTGTAQSPLVMISFPADIADLLSETNDMPQAELDAVSEELPQIRDGDILKPQLSLFVQKAVALGWKKVNRGDEAEEARDEVAARKLYTEADFLYSFVNMAIVTSLTAEEMCDDSLAWKVCRGYILVGRIMSDETVEEPDDDAEMGHSFVRPDPKKRTLH